MKNEHKDLDRLTKELIAKSLLKPASADFDDKLMDKILLAPIPGKLKFNVNNAKRAWIFLMVAVVFMLFSVTIAATIPAGHFTEISNVLKHTYTYMLFGGLALFVPLILFQLDLLLKLKFGEYKEGFSI